MLTLTNLKYFSHFSLSLFFCFFVCLFENPALKYLILIGQYFCIMTAKKNPQRSP